MAIKKKSLTGAAASRRKEVDAKSSQNPGAKPEKPVKPAPVKKLAVAKLATAKLSTARLTVLRKLI
jgi:hypothetical protein